MSSGVPSEEINYLVTLNEVRDYFNHVLGTGESFRKKEDYFQWIISKYTPKVLVFVGDSPNDMRVGSKFSAITIGVVTNHTDEELRQAGAKYVCKPEELLGILKNL